MLFKVRYDGPLSNSAFDFILCRYVKASRRQKKKDDAKPKAKAKAKKPDEVGRCRSTPASPQLDPSPNP